MNFKQSKFFYLHWFIVVFFALIFVFRNYPIMGHDYSYYIPALFDFNYAYNKFDVIFLEFTSQKCSGVPVWANPSGMTFSFIHILSIIFNPIASFVIFYVFIFSLSFWGCFRFLKEFMSNDDQRSTFSLAWALQTFILARAFVGHFQFTTLSLLPFYSYIIFYKDFKGKWYSLYLFIPAIFLANDIYMGGANSFILSLLSLGLFYLFEIFLFQKRNKKDLFMRLFLTVSIATFLIIPKIEASLDLLSNIQRNVSFTTLNISESIIITANMLFSFFPTNYSLITTWNFGNWEAINCLLPGLFFLYVFKLWPQKGRLKIFLGCNFLFFLIGLFLISGVYSEFVKELPVLSSLHVNPRLLMVFNLSILGLYAFFSKGFLETSLEKYIYPLFVIWVAYLNLNSTMLGQAYLAYNDMDTEKNKLNYCYEPVFGYALEKMPSFVRENNFSALIDPRCYLSSFKANCAGDFRLTKESETLFLNYKLRTISE
jgi:hypothetical protein